MRDKYCIVFLFQNSIIKMVNKLLTFPSKQKLYHDSCRISRISKMNVGDVRAT